MRYLIAFSILFFACKTQEQIERRMEHYYNPTYHPKRAYTFIVKNHTYTTDTLDSVLIFKDKKTRELLKGFYKEMTKRRVSTGHRIFDNQIYYIETYRFIKLKKGKLDGYEYYMQLINKIEKIDTMFKCGFLLLGKYANGKLLYHNDNRINSMENMGDGNEDDFGKEKIIY